jgi:hypothetical protein
VGARVVTGIRFFGAESHLFPHTHKYTHRTASVAHAHLYCLFPGLTEANCRHVHHRLHCHWLSSCACHSPLQAWRESCGETVTGMWCGVCKRFSQNRPQVSTDWRTAPCSEPRTNPAHRRTHSIRSGSAGSLSEGVDVDVEAGRVRRTLLGRRVPSACPTVARAACHRAARSGLSLRPSHSNPS